MVFSRVWSVKVTTHVTFITRALGFSRTGKMAEQTCGATALVLDKLPPVLWEGFFMKMARIWIRVPLEFLTFCWCWHLLFGVKCPNSSWLDRIEFDLTYLCLKLRFCQVLLILSWSVHLPWLDCKQIDALLLFMTDFWPQWFIVPSSSLRSWLDYLGWNCKVYIT